MPALVTQRLDIHVREQQLGAARFCAGGAVKDALRLRGEIDAQIVHAVLVEAGVHDLIGMDAGRTGRFCGAGGLFGAFLSHKITSCERVKQNCAFTT